MASKKQKNVHPVHRLKRILMALLSIVIASTVAALLKKRSKK